MSYIAYISCKTLPTKQVWVGYIRIVILAA